MISRIVSATEYYDHVAPYYNDHQTVNDRMVREEVSSIFRQYVSYGNVLDFGGGTGLDIPWLVREGYYVYFLEPSVHMRSIAKQIRLSFADHTPMVFVEEMTDIFQWTPTTLPFYEKMSGILLNFAVLNSINQLIIFFRNISMVCKRDTFLVMTLISSQPKKVLKNYGTSRWIRQLIIGKSVIETHYNDMIHQTFLYSVHIIKKFAGRYFKFVSCRHIANSDFMILILVAK